MRGIDKYDDLDQDIKGCDARIQRAVKALRKARIKVLRVEPADYDVDGSIDVVVDGYPLNVQVHTSDSGFTINEYEYDTAGNLEASRWWGDTPGVTTLPAKLMLVALKAAQRRKAEAVKQNPKKAPVRASHNVVALTGYLRTHPPGKGGAFILRVPFNRLIDGDWVDGYDDLKITASPAYAVALNKLALNTRLAAEIQPMAKGLKLLRVLYLYQRGAA